MSFKNGPEGGFRSVVEWLHTQSKQFKLGEEQQAKYEANFNL